MGFSVGYLVFFGCVVVALTAVGLAWPDKQASS
jgi:hypothetical protein